MMEAAVKRVVLDLLKTTALGKYVRTGDLDPSKVRLSIKNGENKKKRLEKDNGDLEAEKIKLGWDLESATDKSRRFWEAEERRKWRSLLPRVFKQSVQGNTKQSLLIEKMPSRIQPFRYILHLTSSAVSYEHCTFLQPEFTFKQENSD